MKFLFSMIFGLDSGLGQSCIPPIYNQICHEAAIKENFYSIIGNQYCVETCQGKPMDQCNLYLCYSYVCTTQYVTNRGFYDWLSVQKKLVEKITTKI